eukprot:177913_1
MGGPLHKHHWKQQPPIRTTTATNHYRYDSKQIHRIRTTTATIRSHWTGHGIEDDAALRDDEYLEARALYEKKKRKLLQNRSDGHLKNVILSDKVSKASSKYLMKWQPDWVNLGMYRTKMN